MTCFTIRLRFNKDPFEKNGKSGGQRPSILFSKRFSSGLEMGGKPREMFGNLWKAMENNERAYFFKKNSFYTIMDIDEYIRKRTA